MTTPRHSFIPRLMQARDAASYLGMSVSKLRSQDIPRKSDGGSVWYDVYDLDQWADKVPYKENVGENSCDGLFS